MARDDEVRCRRAVAVLPCNAASRYTRQLHDIIGNRWPVAMLSTGQATGCYERRGRERGDGTSFTLTDEGAVPDHQHGGLMILRRNRRAVPDLTVDVTCEDRPGDAW